MMWSLYNIYNIIWNEINNIYHLIFFELRPIALIENSNKILMHIKTIKFKSKKQIWKHISYISNIAYFTGQCIFPLGMEEGKIPDDAITASSSYETKSVGPQNAR